MTFGSPEIRRLFFNKLLSQIDPAYLENLQTYARILKDFGSVQPFSNIIQSEGRHIEALAQLFKSYALPVPRDTWRGKTPSFRSLKEAASAAVRAEEENVALYDKIVKKVGVP